MSEIDRLPRRWWMVDLPGYRPHTEDFRTYSGFDYDSLPPIPSELDGDLAWLSEKPVVPQSLAEPESYDARAERPATGERLADLTGSVALVLPDSFRAFISSRELQRRVRSCTYSYLDLGTFVVPGEGGSLIHFLVDQQWVAHWSLFVGANEEAVIMTHEPFGFGSDATWSLTDDVPPSAFSPNEGEAFVCTTSFSEFLYRFWIENEIWFALADIDGASRPLTDEERRYLNHYASDH